MRDSVPKFHSDVLVRFDHSRVRQPALYADGLEGVPVLVSGKCGRHLQQMDDRLYTLAHAKGSSRGGGRLCAVRALGSRLRVAAADAGLARRPSITLLDCHQKL